MLAEQEPKSSEKKVKREKITKNFYKDEFICSCGCGSDHIQSNLVKKLQEVRDEWKRPIGVSSGVRCMKWNKEVNGAKHSAHLYGFAADLVCSDSHLRYDFIQILMKHFKRVGMYGGWIHVDIDNTLPQEVLWVK